MPIELELRASIPASSASSPAVAPAAQLHVVSGRRLFRELIGQALPGFAAVETRPDRVGSGLARRGDVVSVDGAQRVRESIMPETVLAFRAQAAEVLVVLAGNDPISAARWIEAGASAVLTEDASIGELYDAVARLARGEILLGVAVREGLLANLRARRYEEELRHAPFRSLTKRESAVLNHLAEGASPEEIARVSFVSLNTVRTQIRAVLTKLGVNSVVAAVAAAYRTGWLSPVD